MRGTNGSNLPSQKLTDVDELDEDGLGGPNIPPSTSAVEANRVTVGTIVVKNFATVIGGCSEYLEIVCAFFLSCRYSTASFARIAATFFFHSRSFQKSQDNHFISSNK